MNKINYNPDILNCLASLSYTGIYKHKIEQVGGYDIVITAEEFEKS